MRSLDYFLALTPLNLRRGRIWSLLSLLENAERASRRSVMLSDEVDEDGLIAAAGGRGGGAVSCWCPKWLNHYCCFVIPIC